MDSSKITMSQSERLTSFFRAAQTLCTCSVVGMLIVPAAPALSQATQAAFSRDTLIARTADGTLDALLELALERNPAIIAAKARVVAARARIGPAGLRTDPMLMVGLVNVPVSPLSLTSEDMTMKMIGILQNFPFPGKLSLRRKIAEQDAVASEAALDSTRSTVLRRVKESYYELFYLDQAFEIVERNQKVLGEFASLTEARYSVGSGAQQDVLKARVEASRQAETASTLLENRRSELARLNALLNQQSDEAAQTELPARIRAAAIQPDASRISFRANTLGARVADSPLLPLDELEARAATGSPRLRVHDAMRAAQAERVSLARKDYKPDFEVSIQYGQRSGRAAGMAGAQSGPSRSDMITAQVSFPLRIHRGALQGQAVVEARAELAGFEGDHMEQVAEVRSEVARLVSELERNRTQLAIYQKAVLPQGRAVLASSIASYQSGKSDLLTLLESQATLFTYETAYYRGLTDFAKNVAALEEIVGGEVLR